MRLLALSYCVVCLLLLLAWPVQANPAQSEYGPVEENWGLPTNSRLRLKPGRAAREEEAAKSLARSSAQSSEPPAQEMRIPPKKPAAPVRVKATKAPAKASTQPAPALPSTKTVNALDETGRLVAGNVLQLDFTNDLAISGAYTLDRAGEVNLPLVGKLRLAGKTMEEAHANVYNAYADGFYVKPSFTLKLRDTP